METAMTLSVDDLERLAHIFDIVVEMHDVFGISLEEAAGRFDRYAQETMRFVKGEMFCYETPETLAGEIYYGAEEWQERGLDPRAWYGPEEWQRRSQHPPVPKPYP